MAIDVYTAILGDINGIASPSYGDTSGRGLLEEYMRPLGLVQATLARELGISANRLNELVNGKRGITADTALRLAQRFETSPEFWMNLQSAYESHRGESCDDKLGLKPFRKWCAPFLLVILRPAFCAGRRTYAFCWRVA